MQESDVYNLFNTLDNLTDGELKKEYKLEKIYHNQAINEELKLKISNSEGVIVSGSPEKVYFFLVSFFKGIIFGMDYAANIIAKQPKLNFEGNLLAQLSHKDKWGIEREREGKEGEEEESKIK